jgi:hypothetical protein
MKAFLSPIGVQAIHRSDPLRLINDPPQTPRRSLHRQPRSFLALLQQAVKHLLLLPQPSLRSADRSLCDRLCNRLDDSHLVPYEEHELCGFSSEVVCEMLESRFRNPKTATGSVEGYLGRVGQAVGGLMGVEGEGGDDAVERGDVGLKGGEEIGDGRREERDEIVNRRDERGDVRRFRDEKSESGMHEVERMRNNGEVLIDPRWKTLSCRKVGYLAQSSQHFRSDLLELDEIALRPHHQRRRLLGLLVDSQDRSLRVSDGRGDGFGDVDDPGELGCLADGDRRTEDGRRGGLECAEAWSW